MAADHDTTKSSASDPNPTGLTSPPAESEAHPRQERSTLDPVANQIGSETTDGWHVAASARASRTRNPIRELVQNWRLVPNPLYEPIDLSIGDPTAYGNIKPPLYLVDHMMDVLRCGQHHGYTHSAGMEAARAAVASHFNRSVHGKERTSRDVLLTSGVSGALELALSGLLNEGDNILVPCPGFPLLRTIAEHLGACVRTYPLLAEQGWQIDLKCLDALVDGRTRALVVNNPSNPCGSVWTAAHMEDILRVAAKLHLPILSDEVYADMAFPSSRFHSFGALSRDVPVISVGGISKQFAVPGWRLGWVILHDANRILERAGYRDGLQRLSTRMLLPNALAQAVLPVALGEEKLRNSYLRDFMEHLATNASLIDEKLANTSGVRCIMPQGAMYLMIQVDCARFRAINNTMEFCQQLYAAESVLTLPGECFGASGFVRVVTFPPKQVLAEACMRIERFCSNHKQ
jgi:tyrosine aminotransferase